MESNIQKLEEWIKDDDKIVTMPSLANDLNISIQESTETLTKYVEKEKKSNTTELNVTYVLSGRLKGNKRSAVLMVKENDLEKQKEQFENDPKQVIYSIQKSKTVDFKIIAMIDMYCESSFREKPLIGCIVSKNAVKRVLKVKRLPPPAAPTLKGKSSFFTKTPLKSEEKISKEKPETSKNEIKQKTQGGIASMFNKAAAAKKTEEKPPKIQEKKKQNNSGLSGFLTKSSSSKSNNETKKQNGLKSKSEDTEFDSEEIFKREDLEELMDVDVEEKIEEKPKKAEKLNEAEEKPNKEGGKKKKRARSRSQEKTTKRRKRIVERHDSDSDDLFGNEEEENEDIIGVSDEEPVEPVVVKKPLAPRNKIKRAVDKTYEDEEGFIVTKTEYVYETPSEDEIEEVKKVVEVKPKPMEKKNSSNSENDISPQKGVKGKKGKKVTSGNQPTLMNFFKKK